LSKLLTIQFYILSMLDDKDMPNEMDPFDIRMDPADIENVFGYEANGSDMSNEVCKRM